MAFPQHITGTRESGRVRAWEVGLAQRLALGTGFALVALAFVDAPIVIAWWAIVILNERALRPFVFTRFIAPAAQRDPQLARALAIAAGLLATLLWSVLPSLVWLSPASAGPALAVTMLVAISLHVAILFQRDRVLILSPFILVLLALPFATFSLVQAAFLSLGVVILLTSLAAGILDRDKLMGLIASKEMSRKLAVSNSMQKSQFVATMSHELRTPLNAIIGYSEILQEDVPEASRDDVDRIHGAAHRLLHLVNQVLDISKLDAGQTELEIVAVSPDDLVRRSIASLGDAVARGGNELRTSYEHGGAQAHGDTARLMQCLVILLRNACQFTRDGVIIVRTRADDAHVYLDVADTGIGIRAEDVQRLFRDFEQIEQGKTRSSDGMGLGLALAKRLMNLMQGDIDVASRPGEGSTFTLTIPRTS